MRKAGFMAALSAATLVFSGLALAQGAPGPGPGPGPGAGPGPGMGPGPGYDSRPGPGQKPHMQGGPGQRKHMQDKHPRRPRHQGPGPQVHPPMPMHGQPGSGMEGRGAGPDRNFYKGARLPQEYRSRQYVVDDWRTHQLTAPPRGHHWVQMGADYVLVAIATGIIEQVVLAQ